MSTGLRSSQRSMKVGTCWPGDAAPISHVHSVNSLVVGQFREDAEQAWKSWSGVVPEDSA